jgi:hypothetical protein
MQGHRLVGGREAIQCNNAMHIDDYAYQMPCEGLPVRHESAKAEFLPEGCVNSSILS